MKKITVEDLMKENLDNVLILDVRKKEDFEKGSINECKNKINAFWENINIDELNLPKDKKYMLCAIQATQAHLLPKNLRKRAMPPQA